MKTHKQFILNPLFLISLVMLLLNDHILKEQFPNWITGKLSDVFGVIVFVQFLSVFIKEEHRKFLFMFTAFSFSLWKSELSSGFIELWNSSIPYLKIYRVIDYTDLYCLFTLIPLYRYKPPQFQIKKEIITYPIYLVSITAILATSRSKYFDGNEVYIKDFLKLRMDRNEFFDQMKKDNIQFQKDSLYIFAKDTFDRYILKNIYVSTDTIHSIIIGIKDRKNKIEVYVDKVKVSSDWHQNIFQDYKAFKKFNRKYREYTNNYIYTFDDF